MLSSIIDLFSLSEGWLIGLVLNILRHAIRLQLCYFSIRLLKYCTINIQRKFVIDMVV